MVMKLRMALLMAMLVTTMQPVVSIATVSLQRLLFSFYLCLSSKKA